MEMVIALAALILSILALSVFAACLVMLLMMGARGEARAVEVASAASAVVNDRPVDDQSRGGPSRSETARPYDAAASGAEGEKRRREAVQAREHSNFMNYDGTPQQPIDPNTILGE